jgi:hypothetical protein
MNDMPPALSLASVRARHRRRGWQIAAGDQVFIAVSWPAQNQTHIVVFDNLPELDTRLTEIDSA